MSFSKRVVCIVSVGLVLAWAVCPAQAEFLIHWKLDEGTGTHAEDDSGSTTDHDGTFTTTPTWYDTDDAPISPNNGSVKLSSTTSVVSTADHADLDTLKSFTAMMWIKDEPGGSSYPKMVNKRNSSSYASGYTTTFNCAGDTFQLAVYNGSAQHYSASYSGKTVTGWHHWAAVFDGTQGTGSQGLVTIYLDAVELGHAYINAAVTVGNSEMFYVANSDCYLDPTNKRPLTSQMDDFRFYGSGSDGSGALSKSDIESISQIPEPSTLVLLAAGGLALGLLLLRRRRV